MKIFTGLTIIINLITIILLLIGLLYNFKKPQNKASFGYFMVGSFLIYIISLSCFILSKLFLTHDYYASYMIIFLLSPFIIGRLVKYQTLKKYNIIQTLCFTASLIALIIEYNKF